MTRLEALKALLEKVRAELDTAHNHAAAFPSESAYGRCTWHISHKASGGSLDAAKALHEAVLPGWPWTIENMNSGLSRAWVNSSRGLRTPGYVGESDDPARAWLIAILKALIAEERGE